MLDDIRDTAARLLEMIEKTKAASDGEWVIAAYEGGLYSWELKPPLAGLYSGTSPSSHDWNPCDLSHRFAFVRSGIGKSARAVISEVLLLELERFVELTGLTWGKARAVRRRHISAYDYMRLCPKCTDVVEVKQP